ncbi:MAG: S9 family peptidase [Chitinophagaceae bacterium]
MKKIFTLLLLTPVYLLAQKKPLDHTVYDSWQSIGERMISNDGKWVVYTITPQEGDADIFIQSTESNYKRQIPRGYNAVITEDSRYAVFKIKPTYKQTRDAQIKKKKQEDMPKDSIAIIELGKDSIYKRPNIKGYKTPLKGFDWIAYQKEKDPATIKPANLSTQKTVDSLKRTIDSLAMLVTELKNIKAGSKDVTDADDDPSGAAAASEGSDLVLRNLLSGKERVFKNVSEYYFNTYGQKLAIEITKSSKDSNSKNGVLLFDLVKQKLDTILLGGNDFRNFAFTEDGNKLAFVGDRDTTTSKVLSKTYGLYLYTTGDDSAHLMIDKHSAGMVEGMTISENGAVSFSKSGKRLFFGTIPVPPLKDTSLIDIDLVKVDIWNYKDDYLQTQQLFNLQRDLKKSFLAMYDFDAQNLQQLGSEHFSNIIQTAEGDGSTFIAVTDTGRRVQQQWGVRQLDVYAVNVTNGKKTLVKKNLEGEVYPSSTGKYILLYDNKIKNYLAWDGSSLKNITSKIKVPLYDEENDVPDDPNPYGIMKWQQNDDAVFIYDRYGIWRVDPKAIAAPELMISGRNNKETYRYIQVDAEEKFIKPEQMLVFRKFNNTTKYSGLISSAYINNTFEKTAPIKKEGAYTLGQPIMAKNKHIFLYTIESFGTSPELDVTNVVSNDVVQSKSLASTNPQQSQYNWLIAELYKWKTFNGKDATGILYKPENFDSKKKYPMIIYFYEKLSDGLYNYQAPSPTPSRLNIPFFVSRGYLVFAPDISYEKGHPGKSAFNYIVSGAQALSKNSWVDAKNIGIQGQSWGGYQVAYLITATPMFKAAWAGAPVVNMFSAYGGIRWEGGINRQFQYERTQSRIGATPWQRPDLYIENSPFFNLQKVKTPLVIMSNDADGAVPWYQGIEMFTAMRRLGKPVWLLNYNGEAHNLVERKNRKDIQIREQQYFDWLLKGEKPPKWITEGVPAVKKGKDWGLNIDLQ